MCLMAATTAYLDHDNYFQSQWDQKSLVKQKACSKSLALTITSHLNSERIDIYGAIRT